MANEFLSKYVIPGNRVDIRKLEKGNEIGEEPVIKVYQSQVFDVLSDDRVQVVMPMEKTKIILLPIGAEYDLFFYSPNGLYQCRARVVDREKKSSTYLLVMELISNLRKDQRREFYRFSCALEMSSRLLENEEVSALEKPEGEELLKENLPMKRSIVVDISGGGLRFITEDKYEKGSLVLCKYQLDTEEGTRVYEITGKVLSMKEVENRPGVYEYRVQYLNIDNGAREEIIKFIFEEERKTLKKKE